MNFFASPAFLSAVADVYFPRQTTRIVDAEIDGVRLRLLEVDGRLVTDQIFLDYHAPLSPQDAQAAEPRRAFAPYVVRSVVPWQDVRPVDDGETEIAPFIDWTRFPAYDDYLRDIRARPHVKEYERRRQKLEKAYGPVEFTLDDRRPDVLAMACEWKSAQLRATGLKDFFAVPANVRFFEVLQERGLLFTATLRISGKLLALWLGAVHDNVLSGWIFAHTPAPDLRRFSVGQQLVMALLRHSHESGHRELDFSIGYGDYKLAYASHARVLGPLGPRPLPRQIMHSLKQGLRRNPAVWDFLKKTKSSLGKAPAGPMAEPPPSGLVPIPPPQAQANRPPQDVQPEAKGPAGDASPQAQGISDEEVARLIQLRLEARRNKNFAESDRIRRDLGDRGIELRDGKDPATGEPTTSWARTEPATQA
ncbi:MAG: GNAT family N-acetyltransferase [Alsobacter sp.]